jgi:hypothetical protein
LPALPSRPKIALTVEEVREMRPLRSFALLSAALVVACGGNSAFEGGDGDGGESVAFDALPAAFASAECELLERCYGPLYELFLTFEDCETRAEAAYRDGDFSALEAALEAETIEYDGKKVASCLDVIATRDCAELSQRTIEVCEDAIVGSVEPGGACNVDEECIGSRICEVTDQCPGTCVERYDAGHPCEEDGECSDGLVCSNATNRCVAPAAAGETCGGGIEPQCDGGLLCAGEDENNGQTGTCRSEDELEERGAGEACWPTVGELCAPGLSCVVDSLTPSFSCRAIPASGGVCGIGFPENCPVGEYCVITAAMVVEGTFTGTCERLPRAGEPCAVRAIDIGATCAPYTRCDTSTGTCLGLRNLGESCSSDELCYSENCENGGCAPLRACQ